MTAAAKSLNVEQLDVWRGNQCLLEQLSFRVGPGDCALVLGPNGAGKTTLLRILAGLSRPTAGSVCWGGTSVRRLPFDERTEIAYRGHLEGLKKDLTVTENLNFYHALWNSTDSTVELLEQTGLSSMPDRRMRQLSAGQKRRLGFAALKSQHAQLWILDEPMTNLDAGGRRLVIAWVREHLDNGGSAIVATHQPDEWQGAASLAIDL